MKKEIFVVDRFSTSNKIKQKGFRIKNKTFVIYYYIIA